VIKAGDSILARRAAVAFLLVSFARSLAVLTLSRQITALGIVVMILSGAAAIYASHLHLWDVH
jgi:hypothetical protein